MTMQAGNATCRPGSPARFNPTGAKNVSHTALVPQKRYQRMVVTFGQVEGDFLPANWSHWLIGTLRIRRLPSSKKSSFSGKPDVFADQHAFWDFQGGASLGSHLSQPDLHAGSQ
jgi:hypothetical protein